MQPLLFVFVFTYVFPKIGQGIGGASGAAEFSSLLVPGVVAIACIFQGIQAVALPLVQEFSYTREIEDRVMAPLPVWAVAVEKIVAGALQGVIAGAIVFPLALLIPTTAVHLSVQWFELITFLPLAAVVGASLGLSIGTRVKPQQVPLLFSIIVLPLTFLGATYYPWASLSSLPWLQTIVLLKSARLHRARGCASRSRRGCRTCRCGGSTAGSSDSRSCSAVGDPGVQQAGAVVAAPTERPPERARAGTGPRGRATRAS